MRMMTIRNTVGYLLAGCIFATVLFIKAEQHPHQVFAKASSAIAQQSEVDREQYVGDAACTLCHEKEAQSYVHTAHHLTSQVATKETVLGPFANERSLLTISNPPEGSSDPHLYFQMESRDDGLYETAVAEMGSKKLTRSEKMDVVMGSGVRGQTYLYWLKNQLFELPVSYWTEGHQWINSPGYRDGTSNFSRRADPRCMECHATFIHALSTDPQTNLYDRSSFVVGISCEVCHGPGKLHVTQEQSRTANSQLTTQAIISPAKLDRDRQIDQCALCHNGTARMELEGAFSYSPGQPLDRYFAPSPLEPSDQPDVHGNQVGLLEKSRCFLSSPSMTCSTCHDVHAPERTAAAYSPRCLECHRWQSCGEAKRLGVKIVRNCIDCHMPSQQTNAIVSVTAGRVLRTSIRTHWIKVYPQTGPTP
jgi:hypothetical protein